MMTFGSAGSLQESQFELFADLTQSRASKLGGELTAIAASLRVARDSYDYH